MCKDGADGRQDGAAAGSGDSVSGSECSSKPRFRPSGIRFGRMLKSAENKVGDLFKGFSRSLEDTAEAAAELAAEADAVPHEPTVSDEAGRLPVMLVPGFMSSALEVVESETMPSWTGERVWLAMDKLGISAAICSISKGGRKRLKQLVGATRLDHPDLARSAPDLARSVDGGPCADDEASCTDTEDDTDQDGQDQNKMLMNAWLTHIALGSPTEENDGIAMRPVDGLRGINCLSEGELTKMLSYVFDKFTSFLQSHGYEEGKDLDAAPYDWRFAACALQQRDKYFTRLQEGIERLDAGEGVVVIAHSMGNKMISYFMSWLRDRGEASWANRYVHTWMMVGAPTMGAPKATRGLLFGDRMGLEAFLTEQEGYLMGRSFSSIPGMFPLGSYRSNLFYARKGGALEVSDLRVTLQGGSSRLSGGNVNRVMLLVEWGGGLGESTSLSSGAFHVEGGETALPRERNRFRFAGPGEIPPDATITVVVKETGVPPRLAGQNRFQQMLWDGITLIEEACQGRGGAGVPRAWSQPTGIAELLDPGRLDGDGYVECRLPMPSDRAVNGPWQLGGEVRFRMRWVKLEALIEPRMRGGVLPECWHDPPTKAAVVHKTWSRFAAPYMRLSVDEAVCAETMDGSVGEACEPRAEGDEAPAHAMPADAWRDLHLRDPLFENAGPAAPPVRRVVAVHGVDIPTELFYAVRVRSKRIVAGRKTPFWELDADAALRTPSARLQMKKGTVMEVSAPGHPSGDGTLPSWTLEYARKRWVGVEGGPDSVETVVLPKVDHRMILADRTFYDVAWQVLTKQPVAPRSLDA